MRSRLSSNAFTLIELMIAVAIAVAVMVLAVPRVRGLSGERHLQEKFERFDDFTRRAQLRAVSQQRSWTLIWEKTGISLQPDETTPEELLNADGNVSENFAFDEDESYTLERPTSLLPKKDTPAEWTFWRSGTCEPVIITYAGPAGRWTARYDPLTGRGETIELAVQ